MDMLKYTWPHLPRLDINEEVNSDCKDLSCYSDKKLFNGIEEDNQECLIKLNSDIININ